MHTQTMDDDHSFDMCNIYSAWHGMARHGAGHVRHTTGNTRKFHIDYEWRGFRMQTKNSHRYYGKKKIVTKYCYISFKCAQRGHITHSKWIPNVILVKHTFQTLHFNTSKNTLFLPLFSDRQIFVHIGSYIGFCPARKQAPLNAHEGAFARCS